MKKISEIQYHEPKFGSLRISMLESPNFMSVCSDFECAFLGFARYEILLIAEG